jgi:hypothetical protein
MDIEDRAEQWARQYEAAKDLPSWTGFGLDDLIAAYLAGAAQTQKDYAHG